MRCYPSRFATIANVEVLAKVLDIEREQSFLEILTAGGHCVRDLVNVKTCKEPVGYFRFDGNPQKPNQHVETARLGMNFLKNIFSASKNETLAIDCNSFSQSLVVQAMFEG